MRAWAVRLSEHVPRAGADGPRRVGRASLWARLSLCRSAVGRLNGPASANAESIPTKSYDNAEGFAQHRHWDKVLFDAGLSVITWPKKYAGRDAPLLHWVVFEEEYFRTGAPGRASANGISMLAPTLFAHGTEDQLDRILPKMASGE